MLAKQMKEFNGCLSSSTGIPYRTGQMSHKSVHQYINESFKMTKIIIGGFIGTRFLVFRSYYCHEDHGTQHM